MQAVVDDADWDLHRGHHRRGAARPCGPATCGARSPRRRGSAPTPACSSTPRSTAGTPRPTPAASTAATRAASTSTSTTRPATSPRSTCSSYLDDDGTFDVDGFTHTVEVVFTAQEILVGRRLPDREDRRHDAASSASSAWATPTSAPCSWRSACPTTPTRVGPGRRRSPSLMTGHAYATSAPAPPHAWARSPASPTTRSTCCACCACTATRPRHRSTPTPCPPSCGRRRSRRGTTPCDGGEESGVRNSQASVSRPPARSGS